MDYEYVSDEELADLYDGDPDLDRPRHFEGAQDDGDAETQLRTFMAPDQRNTEDTMDWYARHHANPPFDPDGMCQKVCRYARNIGAMFASAKESQDATPSAYRVFQVENLRRGMVVYFDTVGDSNPFGHIVTVVGRVKGVDRSRLESLIVWTNSVKANELVKVRGNYFRDHWGDQYKFGARWLNGQELKLPSLKPAPTPTPAPTPAPAPVRNTRRLHIMHASLQVQDTPAQISTDISKIFHRAAERKVKWITGTEAFGPKVVSPLESIGGAYGYRVERAAGQDCWVAVKKSFIAGEFKVHWQKIIEGGNVHRDVGVFAVEFATADMGDFTIIAEHLLTARQPNAAEKNQRVNQAVGRYAAVRGAGGGKVFLGSDKNMRDRFRDTFGGIDFTSLQDELKKYEPTHEHGGSNIDVLATWDPDKAVRAAYIRSLNDAEFRLHGDHFLVEGGVDITMSK